MESGSPTDKRTIAFFLILVFVVAVFSAYSLSLDRKLDTVSQRLENLSEEVSELRQTISTTSSMTTINVTSEAFAPVEIYRRVKSSVVLIRVKLESGGAEGSGFIYDPSGDIVTNNHVVEGTSSIRVTFFDGSIADAELVGADPYSDLAVIRVIDAPDEAMPVILGDSSQLSVGEPVVAIGNPFGLSGTVTSGIVSQTGRLLRTETDYSIADVIQIDAAVNPGNSGGPLLNYRGEVIGVTTAMASETGAFSGVGFAIPSNTVERVASSLISTGEYKHPWVGISGTDLDPDTAEAMGLDPSTRGFLVIEVVEGGPAEEAGVRGWRREVVIDGQTMRIGGDVIVGLDGASVEGIQEILVYLDRNKRPGDEIVLNLIRDQGEIELEVVLGELSLP